MSTRVEKVSGLETGKQHVCVLSLSVQIFIFENNIYYRATVESRVIRLVSTGKEGVVFNGLADWLYEGTAAERLLHRLLLYKHPVHLLGPCCWTLLLVPVFWLTVEGTTTMS